MNFQIENYFPPQGVTPSRQCVNLNNIMLPIAAFNNSTSLNNILQELSWIASTFKCICLKNPIINNYNFTVKYNLEVKASTTIDVELFAESTELKVCFARHFKFIENYNGFSIERRDACKNTREALEELFSFCTEIKNWLFNRGYSL